MKIINFIKGQKYPFLYASTAVNLLSGLLKLSVAYISFSPLIALSGLYNLTLCVAKVRFFKFNPKTHKWGRASQRESMRILSFLILILGILFTALGVRLFFKGEQIQYSPYTVIVMIICAIWKTGASVIWLIGKEKAGGIDFIMRLLNISDALISIALTANALFKGVHSDIFGTAVGGTVIFFGVWASLFTERRLKNAQG